MPDKTLAAVAILVSLIAIALSILLKRMYNRHVKVTVACLLDNAEIGRESMTIHRWRATKKLRGPNLERFVEEFLVRLDPTRRITFKNLSGPGGGRGRQMLIPVLTASGEQAIMALQARR